MSSVEIVFWAIVIVAIGGGVITFYPHSNKVVVKNISNGNIWVKDIKTGTDKILNYNTNNSDFNYVVKGDTLIYDVPAYQLSDYKKGKVVDFGTINLNLDSVYARKQRELFNQQLQSMKENQK